MATQIVREGWLIKEGGKRHNWKKRWFTLGNTKQLTYYETRKKDNHKGTIDLTKAKLLRSHKKQKHGFGIICPKRTWYLAAVDNTEREIWLNTLEDMLSLASLRQSSRSAGYSYQDSYSDLGMFEEVKEIPPGPGFAPSGPGFAPSGPGFAPSAPALAPPGPGYESYVQVPLPDGWQMLRDTNGRVFYANHTTKTTQWNRPVAASCPDEYKAPPVIAAAPPRPAKAEKVERKFDSRLVAGQKVKILKRYNNVAPQSIGQVIRRKLDNSVLVNFGTEIDVCFLEGEIADWLEPWGPGPILKVLPSLANQPLEISFNEGRLGLEFRLTKATFIVTKVVRNYEADKKGVQVGMHMVSAIDGFGKSVQGSTARELADNLSKAPRPVMITFVSEQLAEEGVYI